MLARWRLVPLLVHYSRAADICCAFGVHEQRHNQTVETEDFSENEDKDHADKEAGLLSCATYACIANDTDCESR